MTSKAFLMMNPIRICRIFKRVELLFVLGCCWLIVSSQTDLRPRDVNVTLENEFCLRASWAPPEGIHGIQDCEYEYYRIPYIKYEQVRVTKTSITIYPMDIEGGTMKFSLQTFCNITERGEHVVVNITTNPELVHGFLCALHSSTDASCSWTPSTHFPNLRLFYWTGSVPTCGPLSLKECVIYPHPDDVKKRVCHMSEHHLHRKTVYFLFNGTQDNMSVRNTFERQMKENVRPPALEWDLIRDGDNLNIRWTPPDIFNNSWEYLINYTECNKRKNKPLKGVTWSMPVDPHCQYTIKLMAFREKGETPWSDEKTYGENTSGHWLMITAAVIAPLLVAIILFLAFCAVRKYKEQLFPKVPEPKDFLKDLLDNNNKCPAEKLYVPQEEVEDTDICLVLEPLDAERP